jgi:hypothetical protein
MYQPNNGMGVQEATINSETSTLIKNALQFKSR